jgi:hypothetical protein
MRFTTSAALELMMQQRSADRLREAEQSRLAQAAQRGATSTPRRRGALSLAASALMRLVISLF